MLVFFSLSLSLSLSIPLLMLTRFRLLQQWCMTLKVAQKPLLAAKIEVGRAQGLLCESDP
jgi:hypothetical protein